MKIYYTQTKLYYTIWLGIFLSDWLKIIQRFSCNKLFSSYYYPMIYTQTHSLILLEKFPLSESVIYSVLLELDWQKLSPSEKKIIVIQRVAHAITRVTINVALNSLIHKGYINTEYEVTRLPEQLPEQKDIHVTAWRPYAHRTL